jgi:hypothetical protein
MNRRRTMSCASVEGIRGNGHHLPVAVVSLNPGAHEITFFVDLEFPIFGPK